MTTTPTDRTMRAVLHDRYGTSERPPAREGRHSR